MTEKDNRRTAVIGRSGCIVAATVGCVAADGFHDAAEGLWEPLLWRLVVVVGALSLAVGATAAARRVGPAPRWMLGILVAAAGAGWTLGHTPIEGLVLGLTVTQWVVALSTGPAVLLGCMHAVSRGTRHKGDTR